MKKLFLLIVMSVLFASMAYAADDLVSFEEYNFQIINDSAMQKTTVISTDTIRPVIDKLTAYEVYLKGGQPTGEMYIAVYDNTTLASVTEVIGEKEAASGKNSEGERYVRGKKIRNGVIVVQGAYTVANIYYTPR